MTPSELADKLEEYEAKGLMESLWTAMALNVPEIIKSLRFAADMDRLIQEDAQPWFDTCSDGQIEVRVTIRSEVHYFYGQDIYSAARKAVKALKGE